MCLRYMFLSTYSLLFNREWNFEEFKSERVNLRNCIVRRVHSERTCSRILRFNVCDMTGVSEEAKARRTLSQLPQRNVIITAFRLAEGSQVDTRMKQTDVAVFSFKLRDTSTRMALIRLRSLHTYYIMNRNSRHLNYVSLVERGRFLRSRDVGGPRARAQLSQVSWRRGR